MMNPQNTICCLNPTCEHPENIDGVRFCSSCGTPITILRNRYHPIKLLSDIGGFGRTYLAMDTDKLNEICVIKQLAPKQQGSGPLTKAKELFQREAKELQQLGRHPQIPQLLAYFEENGYLYLIQEYVEGKTLDNLPSQRPWSEPEVIQFLGDILPVLEFIHQYSVIHRDIKPSNIIRRHADGKYVLIDFGASKEFQQSIALNPQGTMIGTWGYSPREQLLQGEAYPASDLYSLGVTCFYLLTKVDPHGLYVDKGYEWLKSWQESLPTPISPHLTKILSKLMQKDRQNRYQSAAEVIKALTPPPPPPKPTPPPSTVISPPPRLPASASPRREFLKILGYIAIGGVGVVLFEFWRDRTGKGPIETSTSDTTPTPIETSTLKTFSFETVKLDPYGTINHRETKEAEYLPVDLGGGVTLDMVKIAGGTFMMGSPPNEKERYDNEQQHQVTVSDFYMGKYEVTQEQWQAIMGNNPSDFKKGGKYPVEQVSWNICQDFCQKLSTQTSLSFRLPTEAEWEYACRAGTTTPFYFGETLSTEVANYNGDYTYGSGKKGTYRQETTEVGSFPPNGFGLYDMHGNVWEWCQDDYQQYQNLNKKDSQYVVNKVNANDRIGVLTPYPSVIFVDNNFQLKVLRGGAWFSDPRICRSALRFNISRAIQFYITGFRVVCEVART